MMGGRAVATAVAVSPQRLPLQGDNPPTGGGGGHRPASQNGLEWLLLHRGRQLQEGDTYQWARKGRQGTELLVVLRRVMRMALDWRVPTWVVKLDIRKAFDSVWQESMGGLVATRVGKLRPGGAAPGGRPWEARAWLGLLEAIGSC